MPFYQRLGAVPRKRHTQFRDNGTLLTEEVMGMEGFTGMESILYHLQSPCRVMEVGEFVPIERDEWVPDTHQHRLFDTKEIAAEGNEITERVATVTYTAKSPLPDGYRDAFELSVQLPESEGTTLLFPTIQTCEEGSTSWTEVAADGQSEDDLEHPAPAFEVTASTTTAASGDGGSGKGLAVAGLVAGLLGLALGAVALARTRGARKGSGA